jgi:hypothetical protein
MSIKLTFAMPEHAVKRLKALWDAKDPDLVKRFEDLGVFDFQLFFPERKIKRLKRKRNYK